MDSSSAVGTDRCPLWTLQVEELYETFCLQWRLCQGVVNMKKAFSMSPPSRACRESLLELSRSHRHSLQVGTHLCFKYGTLPQKRPLKINRLVRTAPLLLASFFSPS